MIAMPSGNPLASLIRAVAATVLLAATGCAHGPAMQPSARQDSSDRVLVTGSRIPRPLGRDGLPVTDAPIRIYTSEEMGRAANPWRALRSTDVVVQ
jgi:hypothetical protein